MPDRPTPKPSVFPRTAPLPEGRVRRFWHFGRAIGELAASTAANGLGRLARGEHPDLAQLMLSSGNAGRLAERLSQMRGAVMKVGQLMSMDGHGVLPPHFAELLGRLRDRAHAMPATQLAEVLEGESGSEWHRRFRRFSYGPVAAASIGQVHRAETHQGRVLALKIQYPGFRKGISSDTANLALLARTPGLVPTALDVSALLGCIQAQLEHETDYRAEAATDYRARLGDDPVLSVPAVVDEHCTDQIIATEYAPGAPVDRASSENVHVLVQHMAAPMTLTPFSTTSNQNPEPTMKTFATSLLLCALLEVCSGAQAQSGPPGCPALLQQSFNRLQDERPQSLCQYAGKVLLVVNTASYCGFTSQYEGLEALHAKYAPRGLVVLGFPSNDFGQQEPGSSHEIADFCFNTYGVRFPMFSKSSVVGKSANPLFSSLAKATGTAPAWNFHKYLIDRQGKPVTSFASEVTPSDAALIATLEKALAQK